jgi:hypothetical protein
MLTNGVVLYHDNAGPSTTASSIETVQNLKFELLCHTAYNQYLVPFDYQIIGPLEDAYMALCTTINILCGDIRKLVD